MPKVHAADDPNPGRGGRGRRISTSLAEINVVPLVDVMLVLLVIFMVTAPMIQRGIDVSLPVARRAQPITGERVEISIPLAYRQNHLIYLGTEPLTAAVLQERVRQKMETAAQKDVFLHGDEGVNLGEVMQVFDLLKAAGVRNVGMVSKMPDERRR
jgi:biopolymer transport protein TolR